MIGQKRARQEADVARHVERGATAGRLQATRVRDPGRRPSTSSARTVSGAKPDSPSSTARSVLCPRPVAPSEPYKSISIESGASRMRAPW